MRMTKKGKYNTRSVITITTFQDIHSKSYKNDYGLSFSTHHDVVMMILLTTTVPWQLDLLKLKMTQLI
jgi:hypothetical protein